jgi:adenylylsulfate kinase-like enzyme
MPDIVDRVERARRFTSARRSLLVALTGIDGCGKGYIAGQIRKELEARSYRVATLNIAECRP